MHRCSFPFYVGSLFHKTFIVVTLIILLGDAGNPKSLRGRKGCSFPREWEGVWFQSTVRPYITIEGNKMRSKGLCHIDRGGGKFIVKSGKSCYKCIVFHQKHKNVLQYKETFGCANRDKLGSLCRYIAGDANLYTMFRVDGSAIECPFGTNHLSSGHPYIFSYDRGKGVCEWPESEMESCMDPSKLVFHYQACPNVPGSELMTEEIECHANWRDGSFHYLVAKIHHAHVMSDEEKYRCFIYAFTSKNKSSSDIQLAQSGDATCNGLLSPRDGSRTLTLSIGKSKSMCEFPKWLSSHQEWSTLDGALRLVFSKLKTSKNKGNQNKFPSEDKKKDMVYWVNSTLMRTEIGSDYIVSEESSILCHRIQSGENVEQDLKTRIVIYQSSGCKSGFVCVDFERKSESVIKAKIGSMTRTSEYACDESQFQSNQHNSHLLLVTTTESAKSNLPTFNKLSSPLSSGFYHINGNIPNWLKKVELNVNGKTSQQVSAAVRADRKSVMTINDGQSNYFDKGTRTDETRSRSDNRKLSAAMCDDGITKRLLTFVAGCTVHKADLEVRSTCSNDMNFPKSYVWSHQWKENDFEYLIYQPQRSQSSETSGICLSIQLEERNNRNQFETTEAVSTKESQYRIHKLDSNCDVIPNTDNLPIKESSTPKPSWSNYYSGYDEHTTMSPEREIESINEFIISLKGDCSQVSSGTNGVVCSGTIMLLGKLILLQLLLLLITSTLHKWQ